VGIIGFLARFPSSLITGLCILIVTMMVAYVTGRSENFIVGSTFLVGGLMLGGFFIGAAFSEITAIIIILLVAIIPAFTLSIILLPLLTIIIIAVVVLITIGVLPLMASISSGTELILFFGLAVVEGVFILIAWYREKNETLQQEEISSLRGRLEERIDERTRYTRIAAEIAQEIISSKTLEELLDKAANHTAARFGFTDVGIYLSDDTQHYLELKAARGSETERALRAGKRVKFGPPSLLGWVAENKQQRLVTRIGEDPLHLEAELLSSNQSELGIPILSGDNLLGVMDAQSTRSTIFDNETIVVLQMLASQIATAINNVRLLEVEQGSIKGVVDAYQAGYNINRTGKENEVYQIIQGLFAKTAYMCMVLIPEGEGHKVVAKSDSRLPEGQSLPDFISVSENELAPILTNGLFIGERNRLNSLPYNLISMLRQLQIFSAALIPIIRKGSGAGVVILATREKIPLVQTALQPYINFVQQIGTTLDRIHETQDKDDHILEMETISLTSSRIAKAKTEKDVIEALQEIFQGESKSAVLLVAENNTLRVTTNTNLSQEGEASKLPERLDVPPEEILKQLGNTVLVEEVSKLSALYYAQFHPELSKFIEDEASKLPALHAELIKLINALHFDCAALIPVTRNGEMESLIIVGTTGNQQLTPLVKTYTGITELTRSAFDRIRNERDFENRLNQDNARLLEQTRHLTNQLQTAAEVVEASSEDEIFKAVQRLFQGTPSAAILLVAEKNNLRIAKSADLAQEKELVGLPEWLNVSPADIFKQIGNKPLVEEISKLNALHYAQFHPELQKFIQEDATALPNLDPELFKLIEAAQFSSVGLIPIIRNEELVNLLIVGTKSDQPSAGLIEPYTGVSDLVTSAFGRLHDEKEIEHRLNEDEVIILMSQEITSIRDLQTLYSTLHTHIRQTLGNVNFLLALYNANTNSISVPYLYEKGTDSNDAVNTIEAFPIGEGLTSILIRTKQPLMLVEDAEKRAIALGAKITGKPPKSWLGTPMVVADEVIGAIVVQDVEHEFAFDDNDLRFLTTLSTQVAGTIYNAHLLEETRNRAIQLQTAAEIARDISGSLDLGELLNKAVTLIRERFNFYHAAIFLVDSLNEFAVIREATGEAGTQMKRAGHKLKVGSKSIVGYVTGSGEPLIVNDTTRDATYYANPLLPETRAEAALPLKVGQRILGALDVQSAQPYSFGSEDISVLRILSDQMAVAVINSELFADTQEHLSQHRLLHHVTTAAASGTTLEEALNSAVQGLQVTLGGDRVSILLADKASKTLKINSYAGYSEEVGQLSVPYGEGITGWVAVHLQPQRINDVSQDSRYIQVGSNVRSELAVPLSYRGDLLGVLNVESDQAGAYNENDEEMLGTLGGSLAAIISNARLIEQVRRQVDHERMLYEVTSKIRRSTDMQTIMATTTSELSKVLGARRAQIKLEIEDETKNEARAGSE
jgi:GAF domain-containing protein